MTQGRWEEKVGRESVMVEGSELFACLFLCVPRYHSFPLTKMIKLTRLVRKQMKERANEKATQVNGETGAGG